jgi:single-strand DNA-binding protein
MRVGECRRAHLRRITMSNPTYIKLTGWVTKDPELRRTNAGNTPVCTIRVGTANRWPDRNTGEWREGPASYFDVVCWRGLAVNVAASLRKGHMVTIHGTFRNRIWTDKDNNDRTTLEITASSVGHELTYGWSHFNRTQRASSSAEGELAAGEASRGIEPGEPGEESGQPEMSPFDERYENTGDEDDADDAGTSEAAADSTRLAEVSVPA